MATDVMSESRIFRCGLASIGSCKIIFLPDKKTELQTFFNI